MLPDTQITLAESGASLTVDAKTLSHHQLQRMAAAIAGAGGTLTLRNAGSLGPQIAGALAAVAGKHICFDFT